jgi:hypothetical protein
VFNAEFSERMVDPVRTFKTNFATEGNGEYRLCVMADEVREIVMPMNTCLFIDQSLMRV